MVLFFYCISQVTWLVLILHWLVFDYIRLVSKLIRLMLIGMLSGHNFTFLFRMITKRIILFIFYFIQLFPQILVLLLKFFILHYDTWQFFIYLTITKIGYKIIVQWLLLFSFDFEISEVIIFNIKITVALCDTMIKTIWCLIST